MARQGARTVPNTTTETRCRPPVTTRLDRRYRASTAIVGLSRAIVSDQADAWALPAAMKDAVVRSVSELVSNAVSVSGAIDLIKIRFEWFPTCVLLSVYDASPRAPKRATPITTLAQIDALPDDPESMAFPEVGGWGLHLVETLADATGANWLHPAPQSGKWVWARFNL
jgi:hypothetical protein